MGEGDLGYGERQVTEPNVDEMDASSLSPEILHFYDVLTILHGEVEHAKIRTGPSYYFSGPSLIP